MTTKHGADARILTLGISRLLADDTAGRRSIRWLADRSGIPYSTLRYKLRLRPGAFTSDELFAIADALGVDVRDLYTVGTAEAALGRAA